MEHGFHSYVINSQKISYLASFGTQFGPIVYHPSIRFSNQITIKWFSQKPMFETNTGVPVRVQKKTAVHYFGSPRFIGYLMLGFAGDHHAPRKKRIPVDSPNAVFPSRKSL